MMHSDWRLGKGFTHWWHWGASFEAKTSNALYWFKRKFLAKMTSRKLGIVGQEILR